MVMAIDSFGLRLLVPAATGFVKPRSSVNAIYSTPPDDEDRYGTVQYEYESALVPYGTRTIQSSWRRTVPYEDGTVWYRFEQGYNTCAEIIQVP